MKGVSSNPAERSERADKNYDLLLLLPAFFSVFPPPFFEHRTLKYGQQETINCIDVICHVNAALYSTVWCKELHTISTLKKFAISKFTTIETPLCLLLPFTQAKKC